MDPNQNYTNPNQAQQNYANPNQMNPNQMNQNYMNQNQMNPNQMNQNYTNPNYMNPNYMNQKPSNGAGVAALILGIAGIVTGWLCGLGCILGIVAVILAVMSKKKIGPNGLATGGLVCGIIAIVFGAIFLVCTVCTCGIGGMAMF